MKTKIIQYQSTDGWELSGILYEVSKCKTCVIHIPGLAGNFYSSTYHDFLSKAYYKNRFNYLSVNTRGSEYIKQLKNSKLKNSAMFGYTNEIFDECVFDIKGILNHVHSLGFNKIWLQGHSSGCQKILYSLSNDKTIKKDIAGVILLSPCDDIGLAINHYGSKIMEEKILFAEKYNLEFLPDDFFFNLPIKAKPFLSHFGKNNNFDIFSYYDSNNNFKTIKSNKLPTLVIFGELDYVINFEIVKKLYYSLPNYSLNIISGSGHKYVGFESTLSKITSEYVSKYT